MTRPRISLDEAVVAVLASFGNDAATLASVVAQTGMRVRVCASAEELCAAFNESMAAVIVTEESLAGAAEAIAACLNAQPPWSDVPLLVLSGGRGKAGLPERWQYFRQFGNVTVLDRPLSKGALMIAIEAACRARAWQYVVRDQMRRLTAHNTDLEAQVELRTNALRAETQERKRVESALNEARRLEAIGRLAGGVAHDFNNLLQVISGAGYLLQLIRDDRERADSLVNTILQATERGSKLTQQLLAFGRRQKLSNHPFDVAAHLMGMKELLQQSLREKIVLELRLQADLWHARADVAQLEVALLNLMLNAKYVLPAGGTVTLAARNVRLPAPEIQEVSDLRGDYVCISVADNGPGMPQEVAAQAFEPFFTTKKVGEGSGLGLSQVYGFARQSNGNAWIRTSVRGTEVSILLPRGAVDRPVQKTHSHRATDRPDQLHGVRVLCVEDDEAVAQMTIAQLEALGCATQWAINADAALRFPLEDFDLVFSDVQMPGTMDGIGLARLVEQRRPGMPVLLTSGYIVGPERLQGVGAKVLGKPYSSQDLRAALFRCLGERGR